MTRIDELNQLYNERESLYDRISSASGLSDLAFRLLYYVRMSPDKEWLQSELADTYFFSRKSVNSALDKLTKKGFVELRSNPGKGNRKTVAITEEGEAFCREWVDPAIEADNQSYLRLSEEEQVAYLKLESKALEFLKEELSKTKLLERK